MKIKDNNNNSNNNNNQIIIMPINNNNNNKARKNLYFVHIIIRDDYEYMNKQSEKKHTLRPSISNMLVILVMG